MYGVAFHLILAQVAKLIKVTMSSKEIKKNIVENLSPIYF